jgi:nucleoside-diphosphate-sugar epimerase
MALTVRASVRRETCHNDHRQYDLAAPAVVAKHEAAQMTFRVLIIGGTGQVGAAVVRALAAEPSCAEIVMVNRREASLNANSRVRQVVLDTASPQFPTEVTRLAQGTIEQDDIGRAFVAEFLDGAAPNGIVHLENDTMRQRSRALNRPST